MNDLRCSRGAKSTSNAVSGAKFVCISPPENRPYELTVCPWDAIEIPTHQAVSIAAKVTAGICAKLGSPCRSRSTHGGIGAERQLK